MFTRILLATFMSAMTVAAMTGCQRPSSPPVITAMSQAPASAAPTGAALTRQACELLTPDVAKKYAGNDAQRQLFFDATPPLPVGDDGCYYTGSTREVSVLIYPMPTDPTAPVNHFHVIRADNRVEGVEYEAYWFGPAESIVAVKDGLLINIKVAQIKGAWTDQDRADDIELANQVVPRFG
ncbi:hypothetical protein [Mycolicibacterium sp.]|uniref:hypothetical protein n=1 Tax=Mycolicibacterium sp. TaxID=2320850 RepID=UPI0037C9C115